MKSTAKLRVLVLCHDVIGRNMAGPGIRFTNIAKVLGGQFDVTLGVFDAKNQTDAEVAVVSPEGNYKKYFDRTDVIFAQWLSRPMINYANQTGKVIIFDLYAPVPIEYLANLEFSKAKIDKHKKHELGAIVNMYKEYLSDGYLFTCSNERQRDFWAGFLTASGLVNFDSFHRHQLQNNFLICPMGIDKASPKVAKKLLRDKVGLAKDDFVLLWTGGIWDWFDAQLVVRAMHSLNDPSIKLVFLGTKHPNSIYKEEMSESVLARQLAEDLGLLGKSVFFLDGWVPYDDRAAYLLDADAAIYADKQSLETRFSHRTRVLDHFWAGLPTIASKGDFMSELIEQNRLGLVAERTPESFAAAIKNLSGDSKLYNKIKVNLTKHRSDFTWERSLEPLTVKLVSLDLPVLQAEIINGSGAKQRSRRLPIKSRIRRSAKILLLGQ